MRWLDASRPEVRAAVVSGVYGKTPHSEHHAPMPSDPAEVDVLAAALDVASGTLTGLTAGAVHPPLRVVEDFICYPQTLALTPTLGPLRSVAALWAMQDDGTPLVELEAHQVFGGSVRFVHRGVFSSSGAYYDERVDLAWVWHRALLCACPAPARLRLAYDAGSTITAGARAAVLSLAHELYLQTAPCDECGTCRLPLRTTSVTREGISFNVADPAEPGNLRPGTGLPDVDLWVQQVNPYRVNRPPRVYDATRPPPVVQSIISATPTFPAIPDGRVGASVVVLAQGVVT